MIDLEAIARVAERKIQEAIEEGKFDNLPGRGKPLLMEEDATTPAHLRMTNKVLKNAGVLPDWLQIQKDIVTERAVAVRQREKLIADNAGRRQRLAVLPADHKSKKQEAAQFTAWHLKSRTAHLNRLKSVNTSILKFEMIAPTGSQAFHRFKIEVEMKAFDAEFPPLDNQPALSPDEIDRLQSLECGAVESGSAGRVKSAARELYAAGGGPVRSRLRIAALFGAGQKVAENPPSFENNGSEQ